MRASVETVLRTGGHVGATIARPVLRRTSDAAVATFDAVLDSRLAGDMVERIAASPLAARALHAALEGPLVEALARDLVRYRVADRLLSEELAEQAAARVLESNELWLVVEEIARSPAVTAAIARQSVSFADQVAGGVRTRSRSADAWLEHRARRILRRRPAAAPEPAAPEPAEP